MSNVLVIPDAAPPAHIVNPEAAKAANADAGCGISTGVPPRVKISGKAFKMVDGNGEEKPFPPARMTADEEGNTYLPVIILRAKRLLTKSWYVDAYNPDADAKAPDCFSEDAIKPHPSVTAPQSESCETCQLNAFGSGTDANGAATKGKACSDTKILAVFVPGFGVYSLKIPAASLKNFGLFVKQLSAKSIPIGSIQTLIGFDLNTEYSKLIFGFGGYLPADKLPAVDKVRASAEVNDIIDGSSTTAVAVQPSNAPDTSAADKAAADKAAADKAAADKAAADKAAADKAAADKAAADKASPAAGIDLGLGDLDMGVTAIDVPLETTPPVEDVVVDVTDTVKDAPTDEQLRAELGL